MAEKKRLSVAEILAAARKQDGGGSGGESKAPASSEPAAEATPTHAAEPVAEAAAPIEEAAAPNAPAEEAAPKPKPAAGGARMSVSDILAAARANKGAAPAPAPKPATPKPAAEKPAAKPAAAKPAAAAKSAEPAAAGGARPVRDTSSILAAARASAKAGPVSKAEAAASVKTAPVEKKAAEPKVKVAPPMPTKPAAAKPAAKADTDDRRFFLGAMFGTFLGVGFTSLAATFSVWGLQFARFMFPNVLMEPPSKFKVGPPADFPLGTVSEKFKAQFGVWIVHAEYQGSPELIALRTVCTHLGCTPNWLEGEQKFKCPCHGSGFYKDGINFEGPAPRPLERYAIRLADDGQLEVDKSRLFQEELGQWTDTSSYITV